jgi:hypothetical protein
VLFRLYVIIIIYVLSIEDDGDDVGEDGGESVHSFEIMASQVEVGD